MGGCVFSKSCQGPQLDPGLLGLSRWSQQDFIDAMKFYKPSFRIGYL
jgi:hypothetical protein